LSTTDRRRDVVTVAMDLANEVTTGTLKPAELDAELVDTCRSLFGVVAGPDDPLFELQRDVTRQMLAAGGLSADEVAEWLAVLRRRTGEPPEAPGLPDVPADDISTGSGQHSPEIDGSEPDPEPEVET
jgi:hypothetical protein